MVGVVILVVGGLYLAACIWVAKRLTTKIHNGPARVSALVGLIAVFLVLPHLDAISGHINLRRLCAEQSKTEILGKLPVASSVFDEITKPQAMGKAGNAFTPELEAYVRIRLEEAGYVGFPRVRKQLVRYIRIEDKTEIARQTNFHFEGGWFRTSSEGLGASSCIAAPLPSELVKTLMVRRNDA